MKLTQSSLLSNWILKARIIHTQVPERIENEMKLVNHQDSERYDTHSTTNGRKVKHYLECHI